MLRPVIPSRCGRDEVKRIPRSSRLLFGSRRLAYWLWVTMLLVHMPALVRDWAELLTAHTLDVLGAGFILLNLSIVVFVLKLRSVRWLEFGADPRSLLCLFVAIALVHINAGQDPGQSPRALEGTEAIAGVFFAMGIAPVQRLLDRIGERPAARRVRPVELGRLIYREPLRLEIAVCPCRVPRGPPTV